MKIYLGLVGLFLALGLVYGEPPEELKKLFNECEKEIGFSHPKGPPNLDDPKLKCFAACLLKKEGALVDGKVVAEKKIEFMDKHMTGGASDDAKAAVNECASKANEGKDECEVGGTFYKCMVEKHPH